MKTTRNLNSKYVMRDPPPIDDNPFVQVCMGYAGCVPVKKPNANGVLAKKDIFLSLQI